MIAAAEFAAALLVIVERHDLGIEPCAGRQIDKLGLVAVVDVALDRDLMPARRNVSSVLNVWPLASGAVICFQLATMKSPAALTLLTRS